MSGKDQKQDDAKVDDELSELLDSALEDFTKENKPKKDETDSKAVETVDDTALPDEWTEDFIQQAAKQFGENFANSDVQFTPEMFEQLLKPMADAAQQVLQNPLQPNNTSNNIAASISQTVQGLSAGAEGLQAPLNEEDLRNLLGGGGENNFLDFAQGVMQGLLSKDVLGPSLEDFIQKLPEYIEKNKDKLSKNEIERYENQKKLMVEVLDELNKEKEGVSSTEKSERFNKVLGLMQKLQDYGQPPAELVGDVGDLPFNFDAHGNPTECTIM